MTLLQGLGRLARSDRKFKRNVWQTDSSQTLQFWECYLLWYDIFNCGGWIILFKGKNCWMPLLGRNVYSQRTLLLTVAVAVYVELSYW